MDLRPSSQRICASPRHTLRLSCLVGRGEGSSIASALDLCSMNASRLGSMTICYQSNWFAACMKRKKTPVNQRCICRLVSLQSEVS